MSLTVGSLFSGIGGLDIGLERAGMEVRWQVENDEFCQRVLAKHWADVPRYGDIRGISGSDLEPVDVICGGFPCQPVSHAGRRRGEEDDRFLWPEMLRLICEVRPAYVVGENVFGLVTHNGGLLLSSIVADLEAEGFEVAPPVVFPAAGVGALHRRDRVWICAHSRYNDRSPQQRKQQAKRAEVAKRVRDAAADSESRRLEDERLQPRSRREGQGTPDVDGDRKDAADADTERWDGRSGECRPGWWREPSAGDWWLSEPAVGRVAHGVPSRVDRLKSLGNAVVPQVAELIGRHLIQSEVRL